ncbi:MAG: YibE/F family protein [Treponema sp.]|nr:YibE/F family protein [Treponema sp.]
MWQIKKNVLFQELLAILLTLLGIFLIILIAPKLTERYRQRPQFTQKFVKGTVLEVLENDIEEDAFVENRYLGTQKLLVKINEGEYKDREFEISNTLSALRSAVAYKGLTAIFAIRMDKNGEPVVWLYNYNRSPYIYLLFLVLAFVVIWVGHFRGVRSLLALAFTTVVVLFVIVPCMWSPHPALIAIISLGVSCVASFILIAGFSKKSFCATAGTISGICLAGLLAFLFGSIMNLSGIDMEKGETLLYLAQSRNFKITSLLFVSILIAGLGATMDVAVSIASSAEQLYIADSSMPNHKYFTAIISIGKDIIGTMTNTLILAFCGSSLPLAMMIWGYHMESAQFINIPLIVINILQAVASSIGMVSSVFFTAIISVFVFKNFNTLKESKQN